MSRAKVYNTKPIEDLLTTKSLGGTLQLGVGPGPSCLQHPRNGPAFQAVLCVANGKTSESQMGSSGGFKAFMQAIVRGSNSRSI